jgi:hypothetical protein
MEDKIVKKKMSLSTCSDILNKGAVKYTEEQVLQIREFLYKLAAIEEKEYKQRLSEQTALTIRK